LRNSIRRKLTVAFVIVATGPLLLVGIAASIRSFSVLLQQAHLFESTVARRVSTEVNGFITRMVGELQTVAKAVPGNPPQRKSDLLAFLPSYPETFQDLILTDQDGIREVRISRLEVVSPTEFESWAQTDAFKVPKTTGKMYYGPVEIDQVYGEPSMIISMPVMNVRTGTVDQVLIARVRFKPIWDLLGNINLSSGESVFILDSQKNVIAHRNPSVVLVGRTFTLPAAGQVGTGLDSPTVVVASDSLQYGDQTFTVVAERNLVNALELAIQTVILIGALLLVAFILATVTGYLLARQIVRPVQALARVAQDLSEQSESFDPQKISMVASRTDELGQLAQVFQNMGKQVATREATLKKQVMELKIEIDESKKQSSIKEIVDTEYFRELETKASNFRQARRARVASVNLNSDGESAADSPANKTE